MKKGKRRRDHHIGYTLAKPPNCPRNMDHLNLLRQMGLDLSTRKSEAHTGKSMILSSSGMSWTFSGDAEGLIVARAINAPDEWSMEALLSWMTRKNFVVPIYIPSEKQFTLVSHTLLDGGVVIQNVARLVSHFDSFILDFLNHMKIDGSQLKPLE
jgi:hypothetical protein